MGDEHSPYAAPAPPRDDGPRPSPTAAGLLSFLFPGLGQIYGGRGLRGLVWFAADVVLFVTTVASAHLSVILFWAMFVAIALLGVRIAAAIDASRGAGRAGAQRAGVGLVILAGLGLFVGGRATSLASRALLLEAFTISSGAMQPTLLIGDHLFVDKRRRNPTRGAVIVFEFPENRQQIFVSRVVGMPGERIEIGAGGQLLIDGHEVPRCELGRVQHQVAWIEWLDRGPQPLPHLVLIEPDEVVAGGPWTVAPEEFFVMGDDRQNAYDSRTWLDGRGGGVPVDHVLGTARVIWWSLSAKAGMATERIGLDPHEIALPAHMAALKPKLAKCLAAPPR